MPRCFLFFLIILCCSTQNTYSSEWFKRNFGIGSTIGALGGFYIGRSITTYWDNWYWNRFYLSIDLNQSQFLDLDFGEVEE